MTKAPTVLCILDGFGLNPDTYGNAVLNAKTPNFHKLWNENPHATLVTHGERVGLPAGQMGNSEVGHMNIGAGRVVEQPLVRIGRELREDNLPKFPQYTQFLAATKSSKQIHLIGLCSNGGVHSHYEHLMLLVKRLRKDTDATLLLHLITDGRDTPPESSQKFIETLEHVTSKIPGVHIASICGRFHAMDRDKRWERTQAAYDVITFGKGLKFQSALEAVKTSHARGVTDEFIEASSLGDYEMLPDDGVIFWNFREDRMRQIVSSICVSSLDGFTRARPIPSRERVLCFTEYDHTFGLPFLFEPQSLQNHLGEAVSKAGLTQLRVAETEKYPHVTYFFNAGIETPYPGEERTMVPSPRDVLTYDQKPEMSADGVTEVTLNALDSKKYNLIVVNFANCDMVGHTGIQEAAIKAVETVDTCLGKVADKVKSLNGHLLIIADHGNAELMINYSDETPHTAHTTFPVPVILVGGPVGITLRDDGALCNVAPTLLSLLKVSQPPEMTGVSLIK